MVRLALLGVIFFLQGPGAQTTGMISGRIVDRNVTGIELAVQRGKSIPGRVVIEGKGIMPRFEMEFSGFPSETITPLPDGRFRVSTFEGERQLVLGDFPKGCRVKSIRYGSLDVTSAPMQFATTDTAELRIVLSTEDVGHVRVRGRVAGLENAGPLEEPVRLTLHTRQFVEAPSATVGKDGTFEFTDLLPGSYLIWLHGVKSAHIPRELYVEERDMDSVEIAIPNRKEVQGRIIVQGAGPVPRMKAQWGFEHLPFLDTPRFLIPLGIRETVNPLEINPAPDGTFRIMLSEGEYLLEEIHIPEGDMLGPVTYGRTNLKLQYFEISPTDHAEFEIHVTADLGRPVRVSGRLSGLDRALPGAAPTVSLTSSRYAEVWKAPVRDDGTFEFPQVYPGVYALRLIAPGIRAEACSPVTVRNVDITDVVLAVPLPGATQDKLQIASAIFGAAQGTADVTPIVRRMVKPELDEIFAAAAWLEVDPAVGTNKELTVSYLYQCEDHTFTTGEAGAVSYTMLADHADPSRRPQLTGRGEFKILSAYYGSGRNYTDITTRIEELVNPNTPPLVVSDAAIEGVSTSNHKHLVITYVFEGRRATWKGDTGMTVHYELLRRIASFPEDAHYSKIPILHP